MIGLAYRWPGGVPRRQRRPGGVSGEMGADTLTDMSKHNMCGCMLIRFSAVWLLPFTLL